MSINDNNIPFYLSFVQNIEFKDSIEQIQFKHTTDRIIYQFLLRTGNVGKTREQICAELELPRSSVYDAINRMNLAKLVEIDYKKPRSKKGRPLTVYYLVNFTQGRNR